MNPDCLFLIPEHVQTRWASPENPAAEKGRACFGNDGRKRHAFISLHAGEAATLLDLRLIPGTVRRIWITIDDRTPKMLRGLRIEAFWDGAATPAISAPLGDFFSLGLGRMATFHSALFSSPEGRSFNCYIPMPFRSGARIVVTNESGVDLGSLYYDVDCTIGDDHPDTAAYLHAHWRREAPTTLLEDYTILPQVHGRGRFLGCNLGVIADTGLYYHSWWGEGEVKIYLDGDTANPTLCGTGTEDYIGTGWGQGQYAGLYQGCHVADHEKYHYCFYRLHVPDPVWFQTACRATIQQIGAWTPESMAQMHAAGLQLVHSDKPLDTAAEARARNYGLFERQDDVSSCAWFYLDRPANGLPALPAAAQRYAGLT
ncbi:MAG: DUF2961 domain-containing protein [Anaerolineae bacterium]|jgi:hypothetical protein|nr:DUF2961 domain-containing protein [Anaerolineae bacterium]